MHVLNDNGVVTKVYIFVVVIARNEMTKPVRRSHGADGRSPNARRLPVCATDCTKVSSVKKATPDRPVCAEATMDRLLPKNWDCNDNER